MNVYVPKQYRREKLLKTNNNKTYQNNKGKRKRRTKEREKEGGQEGGKYGRPLLSTVPFSTVSITPNLSTSVRKQMILLRMGHQKVNSSLTLCHNAHVILLMASHLMAFYHLTSLREGCVKSNKIFCERERPHSFNFYYSILLHLYFTINYCY